MKDWMRVIFFAALGMLSSARAQLVNSWTNPVSAPWESASWSLGILPASNQTVVITNAGFKAVGINSATIANFPASVTVSNLFIAAPTNGLNTLLLNFTGSGLFKVLNSCTVGTNGTLANDFSSLEVDGNGLLINGDTIVLSTGGSFTQEGGSTVVNGPIFVHSGICFTTNANLTCGEMTLGSNDFAFGYFTQDAGNATVQSLTLIGGAYTLDDSGTLNAIGGTVVNGSANFNHGSGTNNGDITVTAGSYRIGAGLAQGNKLTVNSDFEQSGGVVNMHEVDWSSMEGDLFSGDLFCGTFNVSGPSLTIGEERISPPGSVNAGSFNIVGTTAVTAGSYTINVTNDLDMAGTSASTNATLTMRGCTLHASNLILESNSDVMQFQGVFFGGDSRFDNGITMGGSEYLLDGGTLETPTIRIGTNATFMHSLGQSTVSALLSIDGTYDMSDGTLLTGGIFLRGLLLLESPPTTNSVINFTNSGLIDLGGTLSTGCSNASPGEVQLSTNANINFLGTPAQLNFSPSASVPWTSGALLVISNWNNSGNVHIFFGTDASGLTAGQLAQIRFVNPGGFAPGNYAAQLLSTGELVPAAALLGFAHIDSTLVLTWPNGFQLLSSTNVAGPYTPVPNATSPWTNSFTQPWEFFRLQ